ncbi:MAG: porin family protein, partial [Bacteroidetes bacterium]|nr:porin family protein [Bacteroidota bacterium]
MSILARTAASLFLIAGFIIYSGIPLSAQSSLSYGWYINAHGGVSQLHGDIQEDDNPMNKLSKETSAGVGIKIGKYLNSFMSANIQFTGTQFIGQNEKKNLEFVSDMIGCQLGLTMNFTNIFFGKKERRINLYGSVGAGFVLYRSVSFLLTTGQTVNNFGYLGIRNQLKMPGYNTFYFPVGAGFDFKLSSQWYFNLETTVGIFMNDQLDATVKGNSNDAYNLTSVGLTYHFREKAKSRIPTSRPLEEKPVIAADPFADEKVDLVYKFPPEIKSFGEFEMKSEIHKGKIDGAASLTQVLPVGFNVLDTSISNAKTEFNMFTLKLSWDEMPADSVFTVNYRIRVDRVFGTLPMASILYLQKTGKEYKFKTTVDVMRAEEPIAEKKIEPEIKPKPGKEDTIPSIPIIEYRLQVSASYKAKIPLKEIRRKVTPKEEIKEDFQYNWYCYTVGSFETYNEAKEYMINRIAEYGLQEAFIVVFYKGRKLKTLGDLKQFFPEETPVQPVVKKEDYCYRVQILATMGKAVDPMSLK